ncbi:adenylate cyclase-inhibiting serotonin receptor signaling pathway [Branchiostoma belcheri]|nr:adenylate cyclase-inhibiting serotonin receptor signaling pathway [Branchiostoma belcheri]
MDGVRRQMLDICDVVDSSPPVTAGLFEGMICLSAGHTRKVSRWNMVFMKAGAVTFFRRPLGRLRDRGDEYARSVIRAAWVDDAIANQEPQRIMRVRVEPTNQPSCWGILDVNEVRAVIVRTSPTDEGGMDVGTPATMSLNDSQSTMMVWNDSVWEWEDLNSTFNTTFSGDGSARESPSTTWLVLTGLVLSLLILVAILGNAMVLLAFIKDRRLCTPANYLIVSMAVADLLVSVSVMPLNATYELMQTWRLGRPACDLWISLDVTSCTASILSLCVIALDRYWAITDAVKYMHQRTTRRAVVMVALVWVASLCISVPPLFGWRTAQDVADPLVCRISQLRSPSYRISRCQGLNGPPPRFSVTMETSQHSHQHLPDYGYTIFSTFGAFYVPSAVILVVYWKIFRAAQRRIRVRVGAQVPPARRNKPRPSDDDTAAESRPTAPQRQNRRQENGQDRADINVKKGAAYEERFSKAPCVATVSEGIAVMERASDGFNSAQNLKKKIVFSKERRAAKTLGIITGVFIVCWLPFFLVALIEPFCASCDISNLTRSVITWLGYANSAMNPVLYGFVNKDFQKAFQKIFRRRNNN